LALLSSIDAFLPITDYTHMVG